MRCQLFAQCGRLFDRRLQHEARDQIGGLPRLGVERECTSSGLHRFGGGERAGIVAHHAGRLEEQHRRDHARPQRDAAGEFDLVQRRGAQRGEGARGDRPPQGLARQGHAEHTLGGVELDPGAVQVQQQAAIAQRVGECADRHGAQGQPGPAPQVAADIKPVFTAVSSS